MRGLEVLGEVWRRVRCLGVVVWRGRGGRDLAYLMALKGVGFILAMYEVEKWWSVDVGGWIELRAIERQ